MTSLHELAALPVKVRVREGLVKALSEKSPSCFTYCTSMRPSGLRYTWARLLLPAGVTLSRSEGSVVLGIEMLRGVYPECNEWAQHDGMVTPAALSPSESVRLSSPQRILMGHFLG